ncbi:DNA cytosine methyltransferase [Nocardiopsis metallicus]|uniref:DNA (cytosine-5-)-methyltransferase n=1 Tax=Nocardiopsis metallicus TaxID=179819 RepID=A0A840WF44_9ACTN|nr:DNA cytosine methyltransferase [Nocardiopsis metallicus]MBB5494734.1 DNA (cytosine-5)-methyltransferase 1 [Nocardiopsis metallicus]
MTIPQEWTLGSLCTGYAGLDLGVSAALGHTRTLWCADPDPHVSELLRQRLPGATNIGDITTADFAALERPDIITAGFPCQDISAAGRRQGITEGTRSGIWSYVVEATRTLEPRFLFVENVAALRWRGGGLDRVLADLATIGYDAHWLCLRAADVGAPHSRERLFLLAHPRKDTAAAHTPGQRQRPGRNRPCPPTTRRTPSQPHRHRLPVANTLPDRHRRLLRYTSLNQSTEHSTRTALARPTPPARDACTAHTMPWGPYTPAIQRWEHVLGRPAPWPTQRGQRGGSRLSPAWVEWLMGLPEEWVTGCEIPNPRQLQMLGNGVVPLQAEVAFRKLARM